MSESRRFAPHPLRWVVEPLMGEATYRERPMFGARGCYLNDRLVLVLCSRGEEPWEGLLIPTERFHHASLLQEVEGLEVHPVLKKWLYLREALPEAFESAALRLVDLIKEADSRVGVASRSRRRR
ncbi:hypothetical protein ACFL6X_04060 [Candidatus Latescibacterota bacterium]